ncbi:MAG: ferrous iron transport protein B [Pseudopedobacter saltans]|uniref:Ferrous iron transport protein B n=1 Tax=Pseudopedobacter saltans TaxID=151895 RepID=A0A2W5F973_9SPHI|nr:MAG: ferrous iron transport protein B [Pseudopedobacter saltans]
MKSEKDNGNVQIALVGNPNGGKTSLFNALTGLRQQVGNFPGVTVDKKTGDTLLDSNIQATMIDLPGTYSLYPRREDEWVAYRVLMRQDKSVNPSIILLVVDASNLKRNLLFCSQLIDLKYPVVIALTMMDIAAKKGIQIDIPGMERDLGVPVVSVNPRKDKGIDALKRLLARVASQKQSQAIKDFIPIKELAPSSITSLQKLIPGTSDYASLHYLINHEEFPLSETLQEEIENAEQTTNFNPTKTQAEEVLQRYRQINTIIQKNVILPDPLQKKLFTEKLDNLLLHRVWGYVIMLAVLFVLFQSVFWIAQYPMDGIDWLFSTFTGWLGGKLPEAWWSDLLVNGLLAGLGGIVVFIPQIMILFGLITLLEDTGYMARISFLSDKLMRKVGLNGKSVMPMISGFACAVPAIMSTRNIENKKERLITILVTPFMSCSARLPIYIVLIGLMAPEDRNFEKGMIMMSMYLLGIVISLLVAFVLKFWIKIKEKSFFIMELPLYRGPRWKNVGITMVEKAKIFVTDAGRIIIIISLVLWFLSSYGPSKKMNLVETKYEQALAAIPSSDTAALEELNLQKGTDKLESSYAGILGHAIEPAIRPLGFDWKIGIALITSFAAREVFVGTMATLYSVESDNDTTLKQKMASAKRIDGSPVYTTATAISLMVFYVLAMQCMSTLAIVKRETKSWKWPVIQFCYMTGLAYLFSFIAYSIFS